MFATSMSAPVLLPWTWREVEAECERRDPVMLSRRAGLEPDPWQADVLRSTAPRLLLNCSRQSGKSTTVGTLAVWTALYTPAALVLLLSPTLRQSSELFKKALAVYQALGRPVPAESESALQLELENGSRIVSLPGKEGTVRGYSGVDLLALDEAAWIPDSLYMSVRPMLAVSGGRLIAMSTPHGTRGFFYEAWKSGAGWDRTEVPASRCPRIPPEFLAEELEAMGEWWYQQEYACQFIDAQTQAFRSEDIDVAFRGEVQPWAL